MAQQPRTANQQGKRSEPQRPCRWLVGRLVADPRPVTLDQPCADGARLLARGDSAADQVAHVAGELGIGIGDRLSLADEAAELFHQRLGPGFLPRVGQLAVSPIGRRQVAVGLQRLREKQRQAPEAASPDRFQFGKDPRNVRGAQGTDILAPDDPVAVDTKVSGTPDDPKAIWARLLGSAPIRVVGIAVTREECGNRFRTVANRDGVDLDPLALQLPVPALRRCTARTSWRKC